VVISWSYLEANEMKDYDAGWFAAADAGHELMTTDDDDDDDARPAAGLTLLFLSLYK